jgi:hypothetical protein
LLALYAYLICELLRYTSETHAIISKSESMAVFSKTCSLEHRITQ